MNRVNTVMYNNFNNYNNPHHNILQNRTIPNPNDTADNTFEQILEQYMSNSTGVINKSSNL